MDLGAAIALWGWGPCGQKVWRPAVAGEGHGGQKSGGSRGQNWGRKENCAHARPIELSRTMKTTIAAPNSR